LILGRRPLKIWVFVADIADELVLALDILLAYNASLDIGRQTLRLAEEEILLWSPGAGPRPSSLVVVEDHVIPVQCQGIVMARFEKPLGVEKGLLEPSPQAHPPEGIYIARTLIQDRQEVLMRVLNSTHRDQKLTRGSPLAHCEPVTLVTDRDMEQPEAQDSNSKLQRSSSEQLRSDLLFIIGYQGNSSFINRFRRTVTIHINYKYTRNNYIIMV
jgi:hypothetical protein